MKCCEGYSWSGHQLTHNLPYASKLPHMVISWPQLLAAFCSKGLSASQNNMGLSLYGQPQYGSLLLLDEY